MAVILVGTLMACSPMSGLPAASGPSDKRAPPTKPRLAVLDSQLEGKVEQTGGRVLAGLLDPRTGKTF